MKTKLIKSLLFCSFAFLLVSSYAGCNQKGPDDWEKHHNSYQPPDKVMDVIGVKPGMVIGEVGAGRGRYVAHMARRVGETGKIYANDIDEKKLDYLNFRCKRDSINNVETILGKVMDPLFPKATLDMVYIVNTYHHLEKPVKLMKNIIPGLKPDGMLVIIEHDPQKVPNMGSHSTAKDVLLKQVKQAGYELVRIETFLTRDNIYILRVKK